MKNSGRHNVKPRGPVIKTQSQLSLIEKSCRIVAEALTLVGKHAKAGVTTYELDQIAEDYIKTKGGRPAFKGYKVENKLFPATLCISIDEEVVHGIPSKERKLEEGMIVSIDCGCEKEGYYGDSAVTYAIGKISEEKRKLMKVTEESLYKGIEQAVAKNKVYDISRNIQEHVEINGFSVTRELVGHGVGKNLHEEPPIPNFVPPLLNRKQYPNAKLYENMTLAIEPMVHLGQKEVYTLADGWTVITADKMPAAHFEHTVIVKENESVILTLRD